MIGFLGLPMFTTMEDQDCLECFCNEVEYNKENFKKYILSKSNIQKAIKNNYRPVLEKVKKMEEISDRIFREKTLKVLFPYTMKIGIK